MIIRPVMAFVVLALATSVMAQSTRIGGGDAKAGFRSIARTLALDLSPARFLWDGRVVGVSGGATTFSDMGYALQLSSDARILRAEIRNTERDRRLLDPLVKRRSEITIGQGVPAGQLQWMAISIKPSRYARPLSIAQAGGAGGTVLQIHSGGSGSPSLALRRTAQDKLAITAVEAGRAGIGRTLWTGPWALDRPHNFVLRFTLSPGNGTVAVWMDGALLVDKRGISVGKMAQGTSSYVKMGAYHSVGLGPDPKASVVNEFANFVPPQFESLARMVDNQPTWPAP